MVKILFPIQKNFRVWLLSIAGLLILAGFSGSNRIPEMSANTNNFRTAMGKRYNEALLYLLSNKWMADTIAAYHIDPDFALAIVFPELVRYSWIRDQMEVIGLFSLYIQYGEEYANFSVGHFQMKPSFVKKLESDALKIELLTSFNREKIGEDSNGESRLARVKRLDSPVWQVRYLISYVKVLDKLYETKKWNNTGEKIKFYATAYNCGYWNSEKYIQNLLKKNLFYTSVIPSNRYCYADISQEFYLFFKTHSKSI